MHDVCITAFQFLYIPMLVNSWARGALVLQINFSYSFIIIPTFSLSTSLWNWSAQLLLGWCLHILLVLVQVVEDLQAVATGGNIRCQVTFFHGSVCWTSHMICSSSDRVHLSNHLYVICQLNLSSTPSLSVSPSSLSLMNLSSQSTRLQQEYLEGGMLKRW